MVRFSLPSQSVIGTWCSTVLFAGLCKHGLSCTEEYFGSCGMQRNVLHINWCATISSAPGPAAAAKNSSGQLERLATRLEDVRVGERDSWIYWYFGSEQ